MRKFVFAVMAVLAMTSIASAVSLSVVQGPDPGAGLRAFTVQATGIGINTLSAFTVSGLCNQTRIDNQPGTALDSYVMFGDVRIPASTPTTVEAVTGPGTMGTLNNYVAGPPAAWDAYLKTGSSWLTSNLTVDLLHLVFADSTDHTVGVKLFTATGTDFATITEYNLTKAIYAPIDGDCDKDGDVDLTDLSSFANGWYGTTKTWATGDYDVDGDVDLTDLSAFATGWYSPRGGGHAEGAAPVPEPGTIVMLVLGALCLASYRLRK